MSGLARLPIELRNTIYEYVIGDIKTLTIPKITIGVSTAQRFRKLLPPCLLLNQQIVLEATHAFIHHTTRIVQELTLSRPEDLCFAIPFTKPLPALLRLTFTSPQSTYSKCPTSIHSIVRRCPQLQHLTLPLHASLFLARDYATDFAPIFTHPSLYNLDIVCVDAPPPGGGHNPARDVDAFKPFDKWWKSKENSFKMTIDLSPKERRFGPGPERSPMRVGGIRWMQCRDIFGA